MSKKDYEFAAAVLKANKPSSLSKAEIAAWMAMVNAFAKGFAANNSKFMHGKFMAACGLDD